MTLVTFDLNGTLLDPGDQADALQGAIRLAMAHTLAGTWRPFDELLAAAGGALPDAMPAHPDVHAALERLQGAGHRLAVVTNSARATAERHLERAGLRPFFERVVGTDEVRAYKPARAVYAHALEVLATAPEDAWLVAAHDWDIVGAHVAGLRTVFVDRGGPPPRTVAPDRSVKRLDALELGMERKGSTSRL